MYCLIYGVPMIRSGNISTVSEFVAMSGSQLVKATLTTTDAGATSITFQFNPTELSFRRSVSLNKAEGARTTKGLPKVTFAYPEPCKITLTNLVFDSFEAGTSVLDKINPIIKATDFAGTLNRPPVFVLAWGSLNYMKCFVESTDYKLTMFLADGTPVRAIVSITLQEIDDS
jgi:hypothetical protein